MDILNQIEDRLLNFTPTRLEHRYRKPLPLLAGLTMIYFIIEYVLNYSIYHQITISSDYYAAHSVETWGKVIAGVGLALILSRYLCSFLHVNLSELRVFLFSCILAIPFSFWLQNEIVFETIERSSLDQRNKAALIMATRSTITPVYNLDTASYDMTENEEYDSVYNQLMYFFRKESAVANSDYVLSKALYFTLAASCGIASNEKLGTTELGGMGKILWTLTNLKEPLTKEKEALYEGVVRDYYDCIYQDRTYKINHLGKRTQEIRKSIADFYDYYISQSNRYYKAAGYKDWKYEDLAQQKWRRGINEMLDVKKSTLKPGLSFYSFRNHPDVRKYYLKQLKDSPDGGINAYVWDDDYADKVASEIQKDVLSYVVPNYITIAEREAFQAKNFPDIVIADINLMPPRKSILDIDLTEEAQDYHYYSQVYNLRNYDKEDDNSQTLAYKALVIPLIGMGFSAFFLVLNTGLLIINLTPARYKKISGIVVIYLIFAQPLVSLSGDHELSEHSYSSKWLYYHEAKISHLHELTSHTLSDVAIRAIRGE